MKECFRLKTVATFLRFDRSERKKLYSRVEMALAGEAALVHMMADMHAPVALEEDTPSLILLLAESSHSCHRTYYLSQEIGYISDKV